MDVEIERRGTLIESYSGGGFCAGVTAEKDRSSLSAVRPAGECTFVTDIFNSQEMAVDVSSLAIASKTENNINNTNLHTVFNVSSEFCE